MDSLVPSTFGKEFTCHYNLGGYNVHCGHMKASGPKNDLNRGRSNLPVGDYCTSIESTTDGESHNYRLLWARKSESGCVTSSADRKSEHVPMMRASQNADTGRTICYAGRADTPAKIREQIEFMVHTENHLAGEHDEKHSRPKQSHYVDQMNGLMKTGTDPNEYTLTYGLNTLTKLTKLSSPSGLFERESMEQEIAAIRTVQQEGGVTIVVPGRPDPIRVKIAPLHFHFNISDAGETMSKLFPSKFSGNDMEEEINGPSYRQLIQLAEDAQANGGIDAVTQECLGKVRNRSGLSVRERFIYTDMLQRKLGLPSVAHCKSSVDRCGVTIALAATNDWAQDNMPPGMTLENFINTPAYKNFYLAQLCRSHQQTLPARFNYDEEDHTDAKLNNRENLIAKKEKQKLNFKMWGSLLVDSLPDDMVKETTWTTSKTLRVTVSVVATIAYVIFYPVIVAFMITVGHILLAVAAGCDIMYAKFKMLNPKDTTEHKPKIVRKLQGLHELPYIFKPWNIHLLTTKKINKDHDLMIKYGFIA